MLPELSEVNLFRMQTPPFPQNLSGLFRCGYVERGVQDLWIKHGRGELYYCNLRIMPLSVASHRFSSPKPAMITRFATAR